MRKDLSDTAPSTAQQLFRVIRHEKPTFPFLLTKNAARWAWAKYIVKQPFLIRKIHGRPMSLDLNDNGISRSLLLVGDREREHRYMLERSINPKDTILDVGANVGYYVLMEHSLVGPQGYIIALEPSPDNINNLRENIRLNGSPKNIHVIHAALDKEDGSVPLHLSSLSNVHSLVHKNTPKATGQSIQVPAISLETIRRNFQPIHLLRMDIEGHEQVILESLLPYVQAKTWTPKILMELHPPKYDSRSFIQSLTALGKCGYEARYLATSHQDQLERYHYTPIQHIPTDGTIRHIAEHLSIPDFIQLYPSSRAVLLSPK